MPNADHPPPHGHRLRTAPWHEEEAVEGPPRHLGRPRDQDGWAPSLILAAVAEVVVDEDCVDLVVFLLSGPDNVSKMHTRWSSTPPGYLVRRKLFI